MNGISVMSCVQSAYGNGSYGIQEKRITISSRRFAGSCGSIRRDQSAMSAESIEEKNRVKNTVQHAKKHEVKRTGDNSADNAAKRTGKKTGKKTSRRSSWMRVFLLAMVFTCMLAGFCIMTRASSREKEKVWKYYTTVTIGYGEDLSDLVFRYCDSSEYASADDYVREICEINSLPWKKGSVPDLRPGTQIVIPYFSTEFK